MKDVGKEGGLGARRAQVSVEMGDVAMLKVAMSRHRCRSRTDV